MSSDGGAKGVYNIKCPVFFFSALALKYIIFLISFFTDLIAKPEEQGLTCPFFELVN